MPQPHRSENHRSTRPDPGKRDPVNRRSCGIWFHGANAVTVSVALVVVVGSGPFDFWSGLFCGLVLFIGAVVAATPKLLQIDQIRGTGSAPDPGASQRRIDGLEIEVALLREELGEILLRLENSGIDTGTWASSNAAGEAKRGAPSEQPDRPLPNLLSKAFSQSGTGPSGTGIERFIRGGSQARNVEGEVGT